MDQKRDELLYSNVKGKNPFKDKRVRQAFYQAIDIDGIQKTVMRGASKPTGLMVGPGINGFGPPSRTSACPTTSKPPRSCWPKPATRTASR
jgi:peptide/nickel transport system substrate-binding protein